jgi:aminopeptidase
VRCTRPLATGSGTVADLILRFESGRVTEVRASSGEDTMRAMIGTDEGAAHLGEVALVDGESRVGQLDLILYSGLLDENATCHIALGHGLESGVEGNPGRSAGELRAVGVNVSSVHTDCMIGGPEVEVDGLPRVGPPVPLLRGNRWQLR